jgi:hypothetical protein
MRALPLWESLIARAILDQLRIAQNQTERPLLDHNTEYMRFETVRA